ncbi:endonuclease/exonuclease/phosphatase family protein [Roseobacter sinensis]|uniref:Endonuclease/exonuclease/phosphatase family protein n=1 Tax=Roseobacter sinensis TaxID=2931391 RepID=A0ABT3BH91_9RHOB|nr:endonuclease/exonuclease/phosphatase family protein [Roseobacter sp. WL0113]MCV3272947.1 endonuclease/exonuclease/phosphatase family protein [Roseobacter sp. WL0113]
MRFATYNVEWFTSLFDDDSRLQMDTAWSARHNVTRAEQATALGEVFRRLDADAVLVVEAPDANSKRQTVAALEDFAGHFDLRARTAVMGFMNETQQEIALLYDPDRVTARHAPRPGTASVPRFDGTFEIDLDIDATRDQVRFSKPPLELDIETASGTAFSLIGAHLKSKAPHGARNTAHAMKLAIANRRKQLAQAIWLRARIDQLLAENRPVMVMGDLNDGPGLDEFEGLFGRSSVEIVMDGPEGALFDPHARLALSARLGAAPTSARFWIQQEKRYLQALLDYIMVSAELRDRGPAWRIWHPLDDPECWADAALREALVTASDHFPVTMDLEI